MGVCNKKQDQKNHTIPCYVHIIFRWEYAADVVYRSSRYQLKQGFFISCSNNPTTNLGKRNHIRTQEKSTRTHLQTIEIEENR